MTYRDEHGDLRHHFTFEDVWTFLAAGALIGLLIVILILGSALLGPVAEKLL